MSYIGSDIKDMNRRIVYDTLLKNGGLSKAAISRMTGISAPTVIKIVDYLKQLGCIEELGEGTIPLGRRPDMFRFNPDFAYAVGVNFSGVDIVIGLMDCAGKFRCTRSVAVVPDFSRVMNSILPDEIHTLIIQSGIQAERIKGICFGLPGVVNHAEKTIGLAPLIGIIEPQNYTPIIEQLEQKFGMPVYFENDANMAAMGEFRARGLHTGDDLLFLTVGKGLGSGIILDGRLRTGPRYFAGELGYMVFERDYVYQGGTAGWLEKAARLDLVRSEKQLSPETADSLAANLALAVINVCIPLDISTAVLGRFSTDACYQTVLEKMNAYLKKMSMLSITCGTPVSADPAVAGCVHLVIDREKDRLFGN